MKVTMETIARRLGLSRNAVSLAMRHHPSIPAVTRERIIAMSRELGYQRNPAHGELMSQIRRKGHGSRMATLGLVNAHSDAKAFRNHPTIPDYVKGCRARARALGYSLNSFWLHEERMDSARWIKILETRGIRGLVVIGLMEQNQIPEQFLPVVEAFPTVVTGVRTRRPALSYACVDHHVLTLRAFEKAVQLGYRRPALVMDPVIDSLVEKRFTAGYRSAQEALPMTRRLPPFLQLREAREKPGIFKHWLDKHKPDVLFTLYTETRDWLKQLRFRIPEDIGLIQLEWRSRQPEWAGMNQHNDITGQAAVDMLLGMIHHGESSIREFPRATLIGPSWVDGKTVRINP